MLAEIRAFQIFSYKDVYTVYGLRGTTPHPDGNQPLSEEETTIGLRVDSADSAVGGQISSNRNRFIKANKIGLRPGGFGTRLRFEQMAPL